MKTIPTLNIGLECPDHSYISAYRAYDYITGLGITIHDIQTRQSKTENTAIYTLSRILTHNEAFQVSEICRQECIAQYDPQGTNTGLYGPKAKQWGEFNLKYFLFSK